MHVKQWIENCNCYIWKKNICCCVCYM